MVGGYELARRLAAGRAVKIGKRAFVGNCGMAAPGRKVPKHGLVAVLSAAPVKAKARLVLDRQPADPAAPAGRRAATTSAPSRRRPG